MQDYYSWVSPQQEYLATGWTVPARVASYLLPDFTSNRDFQDRNLRFSGIPGLRVAGFTKQAICLKHLPTGGVLRLYGRGFAESRAAKAQELDSEAGHYPAKAQTNPTLPLWKSETISQEEDEGLADWSLAAHAPALSAVMARIHAISHYNTGAELDTNPLNGCPRLSWWGKPSLKSLAALLTSDGLMRVNGAKSMPVGHNSRIIYMDDAALELRGPVGDD